MGSQKLQKEENCLKNYGLFEVINPINVSENIPVGCSLATNHPIVSI
jgi:hypothetical protein